MENKFLLCAGGFKAEGLDNTVLTLSEKLVFDRISDFGTYVFLQDGAGFYGNAEKVFCGQTPVRSAASLFK